MDELAADYFAALLEAEPTWAHMLTDYRHAGAFEDVSREAQDAEVARLRSFADRAEQTDPAGLDEQQAVTRAVMVSDAGNRADLLEAQLAELAADPIFGPQTSLPLVMGMLAIPGAEVAAAMVRKLAGIGQYYRDLAERHREGLAGGRLPARFAVEGTLAQLDDALARPVAEDPLLTAVAAPEDGTGLDVDAWREELAQAVETAVRPGMAAYRDLLRDQVLPHARSDERCGLSWLDDGEEAYSRTLRYYTTTDRTAADIHETGLRQVESLAREYRELGPAVVGTADLEEIFEALRSDPALHFEHAQQLVDASHVAMARAEAAMPDWFATLPRAACAIEATDTGAKAFYFEPAPDGSRPGTFYINVGEASSWGTFELESLAFHEAIPGHHLQISIAGELEDVPEFRKHIFNSAYAEGWGLYSERLADEMGLYSSEVDRIGMLSADSLRACRLVVDTGLHALGWSRQQAVDYMLANSPMREGVVRPEIDRYAVSPGQATSYMIGRLEIQRMRREAEQRLGDSFAVKDFHSAVLDSGSLPLDVLDRVVGARLAG